MAASGSGSFFGDRNPVGNHVSGSSLLVSGFDVSVAGNDYNGLACASTTGSCLAVVGFWNQHGDRDSSDVWLV